MAAIIISKDAIVHKVGRLMKISSETGPKASEPGRNKLVIESLPEQSYEIEVEFYGKTIVVNYNYCIRSLAW